MTQRKFFIQMSIVSVTTAATLALLHSFAVFQPYWPLAVFSWVAFVLITLLMFFFGKKAAASQNKNNFLQVVLGFTVMKMFLAVGVVFIYVSIASPKTRLFLVPFFLVYFVYTVFETYFLMILGQDKKVA